MKSNEEKILEVMHTIETKCGSQHELSVAELIEIRTNKTIFTSSTAV